MSTIDTILKPFKFVENELLTAVTKVYNVYHDKTGNDQYDLSNAYLGGAFGAFASVQLAEGHPVIGTIGSIAVLGSSTAIACIKNIKMRKLDQTNVGQSESIKNYKREMYRNVDSMIGRAGLAITTAYLTKYAIKYSLNDIVTGVGMGSDPNNIQDITVAAGLSVLTLYAYTAAIDNDKPAKSKLASIVKGMTSQPELVPIKIRSQ